MKNYYGAWVSNNSGASTTVEWGPFTSQREAENAARAQFGSGWKVHITKNGEEIKTFTIR